MEENKVEIKITESTNVLKDLLDKDIIDATTYQKLLEETEEYQEELTSSLNDYSYIYEIEFLGIGNENNKIYYKNADDTKWLFDWETELGKIQVKFIKVQKSSLEYQSAFYNSQIKKSKVSIKSSIFFG